MPKRTPVNVQLSASYSMAGSTYEDIDTALYNFINDELNISCETNDGFTKVPVIFSIPERAYQIKNTPLLRPNGRTLNYPLLSILRTSLNQNPTNKGRYGVYIPPYYDYYGRGGSINIARVVQQDKTKNFANANAIRRSATKKDKNYQTFPEVNKEIVYENLSVPMPTYVEVSYTITAITDYQQQMNEVLQAFQNFTGTPAAFSINHTGNRYEAFISPDIGTENNSSGLDINERLFKSTLNIMVLGYLIGEGKNQDTPIVVSRESAAKLQIQRERSIVGDEVEQHFGTKSKFRP
jgi:hypothetical protein